MTLFVCAGYATIKDVASDDKVLNLSDICQVMLHVSKTKYERKVDFIFFPSDAFIRSVEDNEFVESAVLNLTQMPMYETFKTFGVNNKCWSHVKVESQNEYIYFTFLEGRGDHNQTSSSEFVDSCVDGIELKGSSAVYGVCLDSIKKTNNKIHFFHEKVFSRSGVLPKCEEETKPQKKQRSKYQQTQSWQTWLRKKYVGDVKWYQEQGMLFLQYNTNILASGAIMVPLGFIMSAGKICKKSISNVSGYALILGCYFANAALGAGGNDSQPVRVEGILPQHNPFYFIGTLEIFKIWVVVSFAMVGAATFFYRMHRSKQKQELEYNP